jgi:DNA repair protein RecN (Recombination protein N)
MSPSSIYLKNLNLRNFATFEDGQITFHQNFNTIIGETGSGKSLILDALQLILGQRADKKYIRKGSDFTIIEACFSIKNTNDKVFFTELGYPCENDEIVIKRIINRSGISKSYLNFQQCPLHLLQQFAKQFIDLVGQFENQKLLDPQYQIQLLDIFAKNSKQLLDYQNSYQQLQHLQQTLSELETNKINNIQRHDFLEFQIREYDSLCISPEEEQKLIEEKEKLINFEKNQESLQQIQTIIEGENCSIQGQFKSLIKQLEQFDVFTSYLPSLQQVQEILDEISYETSNQLDEEIDEQRLSATIDRLDQIQKIKRKYNLELDQIASIINKYRDELNNIANTDEEIEKIKNQIKTVESNTHKIATQLHERRVQAAKEVSKLVTEYINHLNMNGASIEFSALKTDTLTNNGYTLLNVNAETNPGEGMYPLRQIASGGELSRILLAFRQVLASQDSISIFLFDEIDTGIGGETAIKIGETLQKVSTRSQVIAITHLPQIANFAHQLIDIKKESIIHQDKARTFSKINIINEKKNRSAYVKKMVPIS